MRLLLDGQRKLIAALTELAEGDSVLVLDALNKFGVQDEDGFRGATTYILEKHFQLENEVAAEIVDDVMERLNLLPPEQPAQRSGT